MQLLGMTEPGSVPRDTALRSLEYRSGRAIRRNSNELLPLPAFPLANTFHRAAVPGNGSPPQRGPPYLPAARPQLSTPTPAQGNLLL